MVAIRHPWRFWLAVGVVTLLAVWLLRGMLAPFLVGMAVAYICDPAVERLDRNTRVPRWLGTTLVLSAFLLVAVAILIVIVPVVQRQLAGFLADLPRYIELASERLQPIWSRLREDLTREEIERLSQTFGSYAGDAIGWLGTIVGSLWRGGMAVVDVLSFLVITPVVAFYILRDWPKVLDQIDRLIPRPQQQTIHRLMSDIDTTLASFIRGQGLVCLILGSFYAIALSVVDLNFAILVGLTAGFLSFIPYVGTAVGFLSSTGIALVQFDSPAMWAVVIGIFVAGQVLESLLTPKLVGDSIGLHPVWVMFALFAGATLAGFTGVLLAVPVAAIVGVVVRFALDRYRQSSLYRGQEPDTDPALSQADGQGAVAADAGGPADPAASSDTDPGMRG